MNKSSFRGQVRIDWKLVPADTKHCSPFSFEPKRCVTLGTGSSVILASGSPRLCSLGQYHLRVTPWCHMACESPLWCQRLVGQTLSRSLLVPARGGWVNPWKTSDVSVSISDGGERQITPHQSSLRSFSCAKQAPVPVAQSTRRHERNVNILISLRKFQRALRSHVSLSEEFLIYLFFLCVCKNIFKEFSSSAFLTPEIPNFCHISIE